MVYMFLSNCYIVIYLIMNEEYQEIHCENEQSKDKNSYGFR